KTISTPEKGGVDSHEHNVIKTNQPGGSKYVVRGGSKMVVIDSEKEKGFRGADIWDSEGG
ncbi:MAG: hypothetical protein J7K94_02025, partial [Dehalococcoidia bacterium]|nr:hypothetical protein [Dehalococcoidia bacterium]